MNPVGSVLANCVYHSISSYQKYTDAATCFYNLFANISFSSFSLSGRTVFPSKIEEEHLTPDFFSTHSALLQSAAEKKDRLTKNEAIVALCAFVYWLSGKRDCEEVNTFTSAVCNKTIKKTVRNTDKEIVEDFKLFIFEHIHQKLRRNSLTPVSVYCYFPKEVLCIPSRFFFPYEQTETVCYTKQEVDTYIFFRLRYQKKSARKVFLKKVPQIVFSEDLVSRLQHLHETSPFSYIRIDGNLNNWATVLNRFQWPTCVYKTEELLATFVKMQNIFKRREEMDRLVSEDRLNVPQLVVLQQLRNLLFEQFQLFPTDIEKRKIGQISRRFFEQLTGFTDLKIASNTYISESRQNELEFLDLNCDRLEQLYYEKENLEKMRNWQSEDWQLILILCGIAKDFKDNLGHDVHPLDKQFTQWSKSILGSCIMKGPYYSTLLLIKNFPGSGVADLIIKLEKIANHPAQLCASEKLTLAECQLVQNMFKIFYKSDSPVKDLFQLKEWDRLSKRKKTKKKTKGNAIIAGSVNPLVAFHLEQNMMLPSNNIRERVCLFIIPFLTRFQANGHVNFLSKNKGRWKAYGAMNGLKNYSKECSGRLQPHINNFTIHPEALMNKELRRKNAEKEFRELFFTHLQEILNQNREFQDDGLQNKWRRIATRRTWKKMQPKDVKFTPDRITFCSQYLFTCMAIAAVRTFESMDQEPPESLEAFGLHPFDNVYNVLPDQVIDAFLSSGLFQKQHNRLLDVVQV